MDSTVDTSLTPSIQRYGNDVVVPQPSQTNTQNYTVLSSDAAKHDYLTKQNWMNTEQQNIVNQSLQNQQNTSLTDTNNKQNSATDNTNNALKSATDALNGTSSQGTTASGNSYTKTGNDYTDTLAGQNADASAMYKSTQDALTKASTTAGLSDSQRTQMSSLSQQFDQLITQQTQANSMYQGGVQTAGIRTGESRYAGNIAAGEIKQAVDQGLAKISDLTGKKQAALDKMSSSFISDNMAGIKEAYKSYQDYSKQVSDNIKEMHSVVKDQHDQALADQKLAFDQQKEQQTFNKDNNIVSPFYQLAGSSMVYDSKTGQEITSEQYKKLGGKGGDYSDVQQIAPVDNTKHSAIYTEWQDYKSTGGKLSFNDYMQMDANRKATKVTNNITDAAGTYKLQVSQAPSQVAKLKAQGFGWDQIANYFTNLNIDPGTPEIDDALHRSFQSQADYNTWKGSQANIKKGYDAKGNPLP